jgi:1-deoxy-D-xylulose-5-phosphate synthase
MVMDGGTLFEELGFYYVGPIDGHNLDHLLPVLKNVRDIEGRPDPGSRRHAKGQGLRPAEASADKYHGVVKFDVATGAQAKAKPTRRAYTKRVRPEPRQGSREGRQDRRHHRGDAVRHRHRHLQQGLPEAHLRRRHRRAARRDLRRRPCHRRLQAVLRDLFDLPAARLRSGGARRRDPETCRCASRSTAPVSSAPTARPTPARSTMPISAACRTSSSWRPPTKPNSCTWSRQQVAIDDRPSAFRYPRGEGRGVEMPEVGIPLEIGKGRIVREGTKVALFSLRHPSGRMSEGRRRTCGPWPEPPPLPMHAS